MTEKEYHTIELRFDTEEGKQSWIASFLDAGGDQQCCCHAEQINGSWDIMKIIPWTQEEVDEWWGL